MGIDKIEISSLTGKLQDLAKVVDNGDNTLEGNEIQLFQNSAQAAGLSEGEDYKKIFGADINAAPRTQQSTYSTKDVKRMESYVVTILKEEVSVSPSEIKAKLQERLGVSANEPRYKDLQFQVEYILRAINEVGYNSKDDVEKLEKAVKENLHIGKHDDFAKDVLEVLVKNAETSQRSKEYGEMKAAYNNLVDAGMDEEAAYKEVRKEFKNKGSYYKDYLKQGSFAYKIFHMKRKDSKFEKQTIMPTARVTARKAIYKSKSTSSGAVDLDAKATLKANGNYNRYTQKALGGELSFADKISGKDSDMKIARKNRATKNKVEDIREKGISEQKVHSAVDKRSTFGSKITFGLLFKKKTQLFEALKSSGLIVDKGNGEYDVSKLSMLIGEHLGKNYKLDRQSADFKALAEITKTTSALAAATELKNLSEDEAKKLVKMCGYDVQGKNWGKALLSATAGALVTGLSTAASVSANPRPVLDTTITNSNHVEVNISCDTEELANQISKEFESVEGATAEVIGSTISIIVDQKQIVPLFWKASKHIVKSALRAAIPAAALGLIAGLKDSPEKPITSTQFDCTTLEEYEKVLNSEVKQKAIDPKYKEALMMIAKSYATIDKDGNITSWDCEGYKAFLNHAAGNGGVLNREELIGALQELEEKLVNNRNNKEEVINNSEEKPPVEKKPPVDEKPPVEEPKCEVTTRYNLKLDGKNGNLNSVNFYWDELINMYYADCLKENGGTHTMKEIRFKLKAVNNIPLNYGMVPPGVVLPQQLFEDSDCQRLATPNKFKPSPLRKIDKHDGPKANVRKTPQGGYQYGTICPGSTETSWNNTYYKTEAEALRAGKKAIGEEE